MASVENETRKEYSASRARGGAGGGGGGGADSDWPREREFMQVTVLRAMLMLSHGLKYAKSEVSGKLTAALTGAI